MSFTLGVDISTQSIKVILINFLTKEIVYSDQLNYDVDLAHYCTKNGVFLSPDPTISESNPLMWKEGLHVLFSKGELQSLLPKCVAVSVSGQQHGLVCLSGSGELSRAHSKLWNDVSTEPECRLLHSLVGGERAMCALVSNIQKPGYTASKILHVKRHESLVYASTETFLVVHNYINFLLSQRVAAMEPGDASGTGLWDPLSRQWSRVVVESIDPGLQKKLPDVCNDSRVPLGSICPEYASQYHFSPECMVCSGSGDNMMAAIGTGNVREDILTISLGTSATIYAFVSATNPNLSSLVDPSGELAVFCDATNHYLPLVCVANMAHGYEEFLSTHHLTHGEFDALVSQTPPGNKGRVLIPWFCGERTPDVPHAAPVYLGFSLTDLTNPAIMARAILEGHILNLYQGYRKVKKKLPTSFREIRLTGGMANSPVWRQAIANIFQLPCVPLKNNEAAALGAAIHAAWTVQTKQTIDQLCQGLVLLAEEQRCFPEQESLQRYHVMKKLFKSLTQRLIADKSSENSSPFLLKRKLEVF